MQYLPSARAHSLHEMAPSYDRLIEPLFSEDPFVTAGFTLPDSATLPIEQRLRSLYQSGAEVTRAEDGRVPALRCLDVRFLASPDGRWAMALALEEWHSPEGLRHLFRLHVAGGALPNLNRTYAYEEGQFSPWLGAIMGLTEMYRRYVEHYNGNPPPGLSIAHYHFRMDVARKDSAVDAVLPGATYVQPLSRKGGQVQLVEPIMTEGPHFIIEGDGRDTGMILDRNAGDKQFFVLNAEPLVLASTPEGRAHDLEHGASMGSIFQD